MIVLLKNAADAVVREVYVHPVLVPTFRLLARLSTNADKALFGKET